MIEELKIRLKPQDNQTVDAISDALGISKAGTIRMAIRQLRQHLEQNGWSLSVESHPDPKPGRDRNHE